MAKAHEKLVGICGLYCGDCPYYLAGRLGDEEQLAALSRKTGLPIEDIQCDGCLSERVFRDCRECKHGFRTCAAQRLVTWCFQCGEFPCNRLREFSKEHVVNGICHHQQVIEDLEYLRGKGTKDWVAAQEHRSDCPACGRPGYWFSTECTACGAKIR
ncbi:MAG: DUF3795 domain-containing protein [Desulfarculaceae bacterium]|nr:DUF3795 domain-containing protein [Desulfarculaceae bacterium]MCF8048619.1 DUF3795 domain-containing protein [Desulfarculaceae bacterium]MCF8096715.1 DUF3795 domain-containing protein [Desulfarculaceae bacterium]MCF8123011.1 DUF3795 domain-containing protein [Desulfarculaceae bacterium]